MLLWKRLTVGIRGKQQLMNLVIHFQEEEEEQENKMSEEAERRHQEQQNKPQAEVPVQTDQPEATACTSFVNVNFEHEGDCQSIGESKQDVVPVPP